MKIGLMTAWNDLYAPIAQIAAPIMARYCAKHGYSFIAGEYHHRPEEPLTRGDLCKAGMFLQYWHEYDYLMWLDIDSIIMDHNQEIPTWTRHDFLWTYDISGPLSGLWVAKCTPLVRQWIARFQFACAYEYGGGDQYAMQFIMERPPFRFAIDGCLSGKEVGHCYDYDLMGYPKDLVHINGYEPGDWIITFPGMPINRRLEAMADYATRITGMI